MLSIHTILHPTDFSDCSRYAFRLAGMLVSEQGARLVILHGKPTLGPLAAHGKALAELQPEVSQEKLLEVLYQFRVSDPKVQVEHRLVNRGVQEIPRQAPAALNRSQGGIGVGLAMVGNLVQLHGGTVQAFSDGLGQGSEFVVRLPLPSAAYAGRGGAGETRDLSAESPPRRILVADDNGDLVEAVAQLLRRRGHEVCVVGDGPAAQTFRPEVVFLDIELPILSGYEVARHLRQQPGLENVLLVATTGHAEEEVRYRAHDAGFDAHLAKPYRVDDVLNFLAHGRPGGYACPRGTAAPCVKAPSLGAVEEQGPILPTGEAHWPKRTEGGE
jgi:CheY-like chemotaxis protein